MIDRIIESKELLEIWLPWAIILAGTIVVILETVVGMRANYGRYNEKNLGLSARTAWIIQESPSFIIPFALCIYRRPFLVDPMGQINTNFLLLCFFMFHYFYRSFIYSLKIKSNKKVHYMEHILGLLFVSTNGLQIGHFHTYHVKNALFEWNFWIGSALFWIGFLINMDSDNRLIRLRESSKTGGYKIPQGGLFEYVSAANYAGECLEWLGFAIASWSISGFAFSWFTFSNIGPRSYHHHLFYQQTFGQKYPKKRRALIPYVF